MLVDGEKRSGAYAWARALGAALTVLACGEVDSGLQLGEPAPGRPGDESQYLEETETLGEAINGSDACANTPAVKSFTDYFSSTEYISTASYNPAQCSKALRIDINTPKITATHWNVIEDGDTVPTTENSCERLRLGVYVWQSVGSSLSFLGNEWVWGEWKNGRCRVPWLPLETKFHPDSAGVLRIAAVARKHDTAGDSSSGYTTRKLRAQRFATPIATFLLAGKPCQERSFTFDRIANYRGRPVESYNLYRDGVRVATKAQVDDTVITVRDLWFVPKRFERQFYTLRIQNDNGVQSPPSVAVSDEEYCSAYTKVDRIAIVPLVPDGLDPDEVVSTERLEELMHGADSDGPSMDGFLADTSHGLFTPEIRVWPAVPLSKPLSHYQALMGTGVTWTSAPSWMPACANNFTKDCIQGYLPNCNVNDKSPPSIQVSCGNYQSTTQEDEAAFATLRNINPPYRTNTTVFVSVFMGVPGGGAAREGEPSFGVGGGDFKDGNKFAAALEALSHELGHRIGLHHAAGYEPNGAGCDASDDLLFGANPFELGPRCAPHPYGSPVEPMGTSELRRYSNFSQWILGWHDNVETLRPLTSSQKVASGYLYADPTDGDGLVRIELDSAGSSIYLEYRSAEGYDDPDFTDRKDTFQDYGSGIYASFRPGRELDGLQDFSTPAQTFTIDRHAPIVVGDPVQLEDQLGLAVQVTQMNSTRASYKVTWR